LIDKSAGRRAELPAFLSLLGIRLEMKRGTIIPQDEDEGWSWERLLERVANNDVDAGHHRCARVIYADGQ
jgi:hypothetical protein